MPRVVNRLLLALVVAVLLFAFTPISSALALRSPSVAGVGVRSGKPVPVQLTNETGHTTTYHWNATQRGALISLGVQTVQSGRTTTFLVPSQGATAGKMQIALKGTNIFITVPILRPRP
jgi:hypothetical protein